MSGIKIENAITNNKGTPGVITDLIANLPTVAPAGTIFIATDTAEIYTYILITGWVLIGSGSGGGSQDLQQVCNVGFVTDTFITIEQNGTQSKMIVYGNSGIDDRRSALAADTLEDSGFLELENKNSANAKILNNNGVSDERFELPDLGGSGGTLYTKEQLPNGANSILFTDNTGEVVIGNGLQYNEINENFIIQKSDGTDTAFYIDILSRIYSLGDIGSVGAGTRMIINDTTQLISFIASILQINATLNLSNVQEFANNAAAITGGLVVGDIYQTTVAGDAFLKRVI